MIANVLHYTLQLFSNMLYFLGFEFDTGIHYVGEMAGDSVTKFLIDQLTEGQIQWSPLDPTYDEVVIGSTPQDSKTFPIVSGKEDFKNALLEKFPDEKEAIDKYFDMLQVNILQLSGQCVTGWAIRQ